MKKLLLLIFGFCTLGYSQDNLDAELLLNKVSDNIKILSNVRLLELVTLIPEFKSVSLIELTNSL